MKENIIRDKSFIFALKVVKMGKVLISEQHEFILSKQLLRSGTAIGALVKESEHAQSKADFISKMNIALKEANETEYWLMLLKESDYGKPENLSHLLEDCQELTRLLVSIVKLQKNCMLYENKSPHFSIFNSQLSIVNCQFSIVN